MGLKSLAASLILLVLPVAVPVQGQPANACAAAEHRQFDFWVGRWDVYATGTQTLVAHSLIESLYGGCAIRENWMPLKGAGGGSLNLYERKAGRWHQEWVDSSGSRVSFDGRLQGTAIVLTGPSANAAGPGKAGLVRMTFTPQPNGDVRQQGEVSVDEGKNWAASFDFTYRKSS
jgi:hypothetical protein